MSLDSYLNGLFSRKERCFVDDDLLVLSTSSLPDLPNLLNKLNPLLLAPFTDSLPANPNVNDGFPVSVEVSVFEAEI